MFEPPDSPWGAGHRGVDLLGTAGQPVRSAGAGVVTYAGLLAGRGVITVTHHGGLRTTYEPVAASVSVGARVRVGGRIGALTDTMSHCAPRACLHWGLLRGDTYLDPLTLLDTGPPRLLPLETPADESRGATGYPTQPAIGSAKAADLSSAGSPGGTNELTRADNAGANNAGAGNPGADNPGAQTTEVGATGADSTGARQMVSRLAPFTAPAAGGLAGAVVAGYLVSRTRAVPPSRSPPPAGPAGGSGSVVDLDTARRRLRDSA